jgi:hypothetical protein
MVDYVAGFYRTDTPFDDAVLLATLEAVDSLGIGLFPAKIGRTVEDAVTLNTARDFSRSLIPREFFIDGRNARIPFHASSGLDYSFSESSNPRIAPASFLVEFNTQTLTSLALDVDRLMDLVQRVAEVFQPSYAYVYDQRQRARASYSERMFAFDKRKVPLGLFWINYYGPEWVKNIGRLRLERLAQDVPRWRWLPGEGALFAIQVESYDEAVSSHRARQRLFEERLGLEELQKAFPNPGL